MWCYISCVVSVRKRGSREENTQEAQETDLFGYATKFISVSSGYNHVYTIYPARPLSRTHVVTPHSRTSDRRGSYTCYSAPR